MRKTIVVCFFDSQCVLTEFYKICTVNVDNPRGNR